MRLKLGTISFTAAVVFLIIFLTPSIALAKLVHVIPGDFEGRWATKNSNEQWENHVGAATIDWSIGQTAFFQLDGQRFYFNITDTDIMLVQPNSATITAGTEGAEHTLTFNTTPVILNLNGYKGLVGSSFYNSNSDDGSSLTTYLIPNGRYGISFDNAGITYILDEFGNVINISSPDTAVADGNQINLNTAPVTIDPQNYLGTISLGKAAQPLYPSGRFEGLQTFVLPVGMTYKYAIGDASILSFQLEANGNVIPVNQGSAIGGQNLLTFNNSPLIIDVGRYEGVWASIWDSESMRYGSSDHMLVPGARYTVKVDGRNYFRFDIDSNGIIGGVYGTDSGYTGTYTRISGAAYGEANVLWFRNLDVTINPGNNYTPISLNQAVAPVDNVWDGHRQPFVATLVPDMNYKFQVIGAATTPLLQIDGGGNVSTNIPEVGVGGYANFTFNTVNLQIDPVQLESGRVWQFSYHPVTHISTQEVALIPGIDYRIWLTNTAGSQIFSLYDPCATQPGELTFVDRYSDAQVAKLILSCDLLPSDVDGDNIPDEADNCPLIFNPDQIDVDSDEIGDVCDSDLDGDGVDNASDNCPLFPNTDQDDWDMDGTGDVCDDDDDGDLVSDSKDNCPLDANIIQTDSDGDGKGDICDLDDDEDGVEDEFDNCHFTANENQWDFDGDGEGNACDGDSDGDNVVNENDYCDATPGNTMVNEEGCSGPQFLVLSCPNDAFANHGRYVSCISHAAIDAVNQGLLTQQEKSRFVKEAAKKK